MANFHNNATTFRPYDPGAAIGDTSPTLPEPPPPDQGGGCGGIGLVILIIVIVVATIFTAGAAALAFSGALAGASAGTVFAAGTAALAGTAFAGVSAGAAFAGAIIGGAVGSIVGQGLSIAAGYQDKFSWRQVGISALGSGLSVGLGSAFNGAQGGLAVKAGLQAGSNTAAAFNAGVNSIATQGVMVAAGLQEKFSWKSVAASAVSAAVSNQISTSIQGAPIRDGAGNLQTGADGQIMRANTAFANYNAGAARVTSDFISGITGAYIRHGIANSQINFRDAAAESVGNALGNEIVGGLIRKEETSKALAFDYSLAEGEAGAPGLRSSHRNGSELGRLSALDNSRSAPFLERSLADAGRTTQVDVEELPVQTVIGKRINPLTDRLTNYKPDFLGTARNWWNAYRSGENSLGDTIRGLWDNLDFDYKIEFRAANLAGAAGFAAFGSAPSGIGLVGFGTIAGVQGDAAYAKLQSVWEGERVSTGIEQGLEYLGVSERYAERAAVGAEFLTGIPLVATSLPLTGNLGIGIPVARSTNSLNIVLDFDKYENQILYRAMTPRDFAKMDRTGVIPSTGETFISPDQFYSRGFDGIVVRLTVKPGTMESLSEIGVTGNHGTARLFPELPRALPGWSDSSVQFKLEASGRLNINNGSGVVNTGLGRGPGLRLFNENMIQFERLN